MARSKDRTRWHDMPEPVRAAVEKAVGGKVVHAENCDGGFSTGLASRLLLADGRSVFAKAADGVTWPWEAETHRAEARVNAVLPAGLAAPRLLHVLDDGEWIVLIFENIDGVPPTQPWNTSDLVRVAEQVAALPRAAGLDLPRDHPRLGGWASMTPGQLAPHSAWAAGRHACLVNLENEGILAAQGDALVHFDLYPFNILLTPHRVMFVDWPHARLGAPIVDLVMLLSSAAADGHDPEPVLRRHGGPGVAPEAVDAILAAHAGFLISGAVSATAPGLQAIAAAKLHLGLGALTWLQQRLTR
jgi:hypothetical protein